MSSPTVKAGPAGENRRDPTNRWRRTLEGVIGTAATEGNRIEVLVNGDQIFPSMLETIASARHTIDFLTFVYWDGEIGTRFARELAARARAGVRVRVLLDGWGAHPMDKELIEQMEQAGVLVRWFRPITRFRPGRVNHRTHRKVLIADESVAFTGGVGIADVWKGDARNEHEWRDTHFRIDGPAVDGLRAAFLADWAETDLELFDEGVDRFPEQGQQGQSIVQCVRSAAGPGQSDLALLFRTLLQLAEERLRIATAYFVPDDDLTRRLCAAADRGVEVQVLLPGPHADKRFVQLGAEATYDELLEHGVRIASFQPSMLHAKITTVDGLLATVGSANFNARSMSLDDEINVVVIDRKLVQQLDDQFDQDLARSIELSRDRWNRRPLMRRAVERAVAPFRPVS